MSSSAADLSRAFLDAGWQPVDCEKVPGPPVIHGVFFGGFATCAVVLSESAADVTSIWRNVQGVLAELRSDKVIDGSKDLYLIFVVETIEDDSTAELQRALDDVRVCRKICLERRGRLLSEVLDDIPFFRTPGAAPPAKARPVDPGNVIAGLSSKVRGDLDMRSPEQVVRRLINGEYESR